MDFENAMEAVLKQSKYDALTGRLFDWRGWLKERALEFFTRILELIDIDFSSLFNPSANNWINSWISALRILGVILLIIIVVKLTIYVRNRIMRRNRTSKGIFEDIDKEASTAAGLLEASAGLASNGYHRDAVRYCLAAILLALDKKKIYRLNFTKTNGQILRELKYIIPSIIPSMSSIVNIFNAVWFGHRNITEAQFNKYWQEASILVSEVEANKKK